MEVSFQFLGVVSLEVEVLEDFFGRVLGEFLEGLVLVLFGEVEGVSNSVVQVASTGGEGVELYQK